MLDYFDALWEFVHIIFAGFSYHAKNMEKLKQELKKS
jgi:hypothetical protein